MFEVGLKLGLAGERGAVIPESEQGGREKRAVCAAGGVTAESQRPSDAVWT